MVQSFYRAQLCAGRTEKDVYGRQGPCTLEKPAFQSGGCRRCKAAGKGGCISQAKGQSHRLCAMGRSRECGAPAAENESAPNFADRAFGGFCPLLFCV